MPLTNNYFKLGSTVPELFSIADAELHLKSLPGSWSAWIDVDPGEKNLRNIFAMMKLYILTVYKCKIKINNS